MKEKSLKIVKVILREENAALRAEVEHYKKSPPANYEVMAQVLKLDRDNAALRKVVEAVQVVDDEHELDTESDLSPGIERLRAALSALKEARG